MPVLTRVRSMLFMPATRADMIAKIPRFAPDVAAVDLEDAVAPGDKECTRRTAADAIDALGPGGVSTVPPATPVRFWSSTDTKDAPPPTVTWAGTPPGRLSRNWLAPPASRKGSVPAGLGRLTSRMSVPAVTATTATLPPRRSTSVRWVPPARSMLHVTAELSTTFTAYPQGAV